VGLLVASINQPCDVPLRVFLALFMARLVVAMPVMVVRRLTQQRSYIRVTADRLQSVIDFLGVVWFVFGNWWLFSSTQCKDTSPILYYGSWTFIIIGYFFISLPLLLCLAMMCCLPCVICLARYIKEDEKRGTPEAIIKALPLETFKDGSMDKEDAVCVICLSEYTDGEEFKRLPCKHHFHPKCIDEWLHINTQ